MSDTNFTDIINSIVGEVISTTTIPAIKLTQVDEKTTVFNSKIGGKPYLPNGFNYPMTHEDEPQPLTLLAQLNFEEFDQLEEFPSTGILQFYINGNSDRVGMDITNFTNSSGFRVIYHKNIITDETLLVDPPNISTYNVPFKKCVKLVGEKVDTTMPIEDFRIEKLMKKFSIKYNVDEDELVQEFYDNMLLGLNITKFGGYAGFSLEDPRKDEKYSNFTINLFSSESEDFVCWGDAGVGSFLIQPNDLKQLNFTNILYFWEQQ